jgi:acetyltransferase
VPTFKTPEAAIEAFLYLKNFHVNQKLLLQTPAQLETSKPADIEGAKLIIDNVLMEGRSILTELYPMAVLAAFNIPTTRASLARKANEVLIHAEYIGYPVAMKIYPKDISHKNDVDGVRLGLSNATAVQSAFSSIMEKVKAQQPESRIEGIIAEKMYIAKAGREVLVGMFTDPIFGPVISFGAGGTAVEILRDRDASLPPLNHTLAKELISRTKIAKILGPFRNFPAANVNAVEEILLRVSEMACEIPQIKELDINPLIVDDTMATAVDARIAVHHYSGMTRYDHMAIHPYPHHLVVREQLHTGTSVTIRSIRPEDAEMEKAFIATLSPQSKYLRFMPGMKALSPDLLARFTQIDYDLEMALVAIMNQDGTEIEARVGVVRYITSSDQTSCEFAIVVADAWQKQVIAFRLMKALGESARDKGLRSMEGSVLAENKTMLEFCKPQAFDAEPNLQDRNLVIVRKYLH